MKLTSYEVNFIIPYFIADVNRKHEAYFIKFTSQKPSHSTREGFDMIE